MTVLPLLALLSMQQATFDQERLNPALRLTDMLYLRIWQKGYDDAKNGVKPDLFLNTFRGEIGKPSGPLGSDSVSTLWMRSPEGSFYWGGYQAFKGRRSNEDIERDKERVQKAIEAGRQTLSFQGYLKVLPTFVGKGKASKPADPNELKNVRVALKVGARVYAPQAQPGDLRFSDHNLHVEFDPLDAHSSYLPVPPSTGIGVPADFNYYTREHQEGFEYYEGQFVVTFDLFEPDGTPRIPKGYDKISVVVYNGPYNREVPFDLSLLTKIQK